MNHAVHNKQVSFIWSIADDCPRDTGVSKEEISKDDNIRGRVFVELGMLKQDAVVALIEQQITKPEHDRHHRQWHPQDVSDPEEPLLSPA